MLVHLISQTLLDIKRQIGPDTTIMNHFNNPLSPIYGHTYVSYYTWSYMSYIYMHIYDMKAEGGLLGKGGQVGEAGTGEVKPMNMIKVHDILE